MTKHRRFAKMFVAIAVGVVIVAAAVLYFFYSSVQDNERAQMEKIRSIAAMIDPSDIKSLNGDNSDAKKQTYKNLLSRLVDVVNANHDISYLYILKVKGNDVIFSVDSGSVQDGETWPGKVYDDVSPKLRKTFETGQPQFHGLTDGNNTDEWGTWVTAYAPIKDTDGKVLAVICMDTARNEYLANIIIDTSPPVLIILIFITILIFYRRGVKQERRHLEQEKELLSVASHEVRSPMVSIKWVLDDLLKRSTDLSANDHKTITMVNENTGKIINSINAILESTPSWGKGKIGNDRIKVRAMLLEIIDRLSLVAAEHKTTIKIDDSLGDNVNVRGDQKNLEHAFYNIINNALKYSFVDSEVKISYTKVGKIHRFVISDQGPGIKPEDREKIFEGMYRTEEAKNSGQIGTGLGLYFVKKIIDDHKGKIFVDPDYTGGTAFVVELLE